MSEVVEGKMPNSPPELRTGQHTNESQKGREDHDQYRSSQNTFGGDQINGKNPNENYKLSNQISFENINDETAAGSKPDGVTIGATNVESLRNLNETDLTVAPEMHRRNNMSRESQNQTNQTLTTQEKALDMHGQPAMFESTQFVSII